MLKCARTLAFVVVIALVAFFSVGPIRAQTIHVLLVADTVDSRIGQSCQNDLGQMATALDAFVPRQRLDSPIGSFGRYEEPPMLKGWDVTKRAVLNAIDACRVRRDDTLFFYWSGHGGYDGQGGHFMKMPNNDRLYRSEVTDRIMRKETRLAVILTDCCNNFVPIKLPRAAPRLLPPREVAPLFDELFFRSRGLVDINACAKDEVALCVKSGGLFTLSLAGFVPVSAPLGGLYGRRDDRGIGIEPGGPGGGNRPGDEAKRGFFWEHCLRRLVWQDLMKDVAPTVRRGFERFRSETNQRTQTVTAWSLPPILREDDHIIEINGRQIDNESDYTRAVSSSPREMRFTVRRVGERLHMRTSLRNGPRRRFGVDAENDSACGVRVVEVVPGSPAARAELVRRTEGSVLVEEDDVLLQINRQAINSYDEFADAVRRSPGTMYFMLKNHRDGRVHWLKVNLRQSRPRFGVDVSARRGRGVRVTQVVSGSPATRAALAH